MTDQLERDLTRMFHQRADQTDVPPVPLDLFTAEAQRPWGRRAAIGLVAAAAAAAIAVPLGISARHDDRVVPPTQQPTEEPNALHGTELPYVLQDELHVGDLIQPVEPNTWLETAGSSILLASSDDDGSDIRWQWLNGDELEALPYLGGFQGARPSYDGQVAASPVGTDASVSIRVWDLATGSVIDTVELTDDTVTEDQWFWGFDAAGWLYWQDGEVQRARTPDGDVITINTGGGDFAGIAPGGILVRSGEADTVTIATVRTDGSVSLGDQVPVSATATWRDATTVAYQETGTGRVHVLDVTTGQRTEVTVEDRTSIVPVGWNGEDVVVTANGEGAMIDVIAVDPATGEHRVMFSYGTDEPNPFAAIGGTGAF